MPGDAIVQLYAKIPWWALQLPNMFILYTTQIVFKKYGLCLKSYLYYTACCLLVVGWAGSETIRKAGNSLFHAHFLGVAYLILFGFLGSWLYLREPISKSDLIGAIIISIGALVIIIGKMQ